MTERLLLACSLVLLCVRCSNSGSENGAGTTGADAGTASNADGGQDPGADAGLVGPFTITLAPQTLTVAQGGGAQVTVTLVRSSTFAGPVRIELEALPAGVTATPLTLTNSASSGVFYLAASATAALATSTVTVRGVANGAEVGVPYPIRVVGPPGTLDTTFGNGGKVVTSLGPPKSDTANAALVQKDGKVIVVGTSDQGTSLDFALARYNLDGVLDPTFGNGGVTLTNFDYAQDVAYTAAFDKAGRIVVLGTSTATSAALALARYTPDGKLDTSFGIDGKLTTVVTGTTDIPTSIAVDGSGKILVGLRVLNPSPPATYRYRVVRFDDTGALDPSFGSSTGALFTEMYNFRRAVFLLPQSSDRVVALGNTTYGTQGSSCSSFALERFSSAGILDPSFGTNGLTTTQLASRCNYPDAIGVQADGKILAVGNTSFDSQNLNENLSAPHDLGISRYTPDGLVDTTFAQTGSLTISGANNDSKAAGVVEQLDKKIVMAGWSRDNFVSVRVMPDGTPDPTWGLGDLLQLDFENGSVDRASAIVLLPDDRIVLVGTSNNRFALARYWP